MSNPEATLRPCCDSWAGMEHQADCPVIKNEAASVVGPGMEPGGSEPRQGGTPERTTGVLPASPRFEHDPADQEWILAGAYETILETVPGRDIAGTKETPERCARAWKELTSGYATSPEDLLKTFDAQRYDEMIVVSPIPFESLCEHHLLPFIGEAHVVYIPNGRIVGLSKIPRVVEALSKRLQVQERLTVEIADVIEKALRPVGVLVRIDAEHSCARVRGVRKQVRMRTQVIRGAIMEKPEARAEALSLIG